MLYKAAGNKDDTLAASYRDVDLYLTVARNLLSGAGAPATGSDEVWGGDLKVKSRLGSDEEVLARLKDVQSLKLQQPSGDPPTVIYGGMLFTGRSSSRAATTPSQRS